MKSLAKFLIPVALVVIAVLVIVELSREPVRPTLVPELAEGSVPAAMADTASPAPSTNIAARPAAKAAELPEGPLPISKLRMPIEFYESGAVKSQIEADFADIPDEGEVKASNVLAQTFAPDGTVRVSLALENCVVDRGSNIVSSEAGIRLDRDDLVITGRGFEWRMDDEVVEIKNEAKVVMRHSLRSRWELGDQ